MADSHRIFPARLVPSLNVRCVAGCPARRVDRAAAAYLTKVRRCAAASGRSQAGSVGRPWRGSVAEVRRVMCRSRST